MIKLFKIKSDKDRWEISAIGFKDAAEKFHKLIGSSFYKKRKIAAAKFVFKTKVEKYKIEKEIWIWSDGQIDIK